MLNKTQIELVENNIKLVYYVVNRFNIKKYSKNELYSEGFVGLVKASQTFNNEIGKFSSYAYKVITNYILMFLRRNKKYEKHIQLSHLKYNTIEEISDNQIYNYDIKELMQIVYNNCNDLEKTVLTYHLKGFKSTEISPILNISQSYVSRIILKIIKKNSIFFQTNAHNINIQQTKGV